MGTTVQGREEAAAAGGIVGKGTGVSGGDGGGGAGPSRGRPRAITEEKAYPASPSVGEGGRSILRRPNPPLWSATVKGRERALAEREREREEKRVGWRRMHLFLRRGVVS